MRDAAARDFGWRPPARARPRPALTAEEILAALATAGFEADPVQQLEFVQDPDEQHAWLSIPVFTERMLPGLAYDKRMAVLAEVGSVAAAESAWAIFTATAR
jgi:hypothetical protein